MKSTALENSKGHGNINFQKFKLISMKEVLDWGGQVGAT